MHTDAEIIQQEIAAVISAKEFLLQKKASLLELSKKAGAFQNQGPESVNNATNIVLGLAVALKYTSEDSSAVNQSLEGTT